MDTGAAHPAQETHGASPRHPNSSSVTPASSPTSRPPGETKTNPQTRRLTARPACLRTAGLQPAGSPEMRPESSSQVLFCAEKCCRRGFLSLCSRFCSCGNLNHFLGRGRTFARVAACLGRLPGRRSQKCLLLTRCLPSPGPQPPSENGGGRPRVPKGRRHVSGSVSAFLFQCISLEEFLIGDLALRCSDLWGRRQTSLFRFGPSFESGAFFPGRFLPLSDL